MSEAVAAGAHGDLQEVAESKDVSAADRAEIDIQAFRRGDPDSFGEILCRFGGLVHSIAASHAPDRDAQEDLYQEICIRVWQQRSSYEPRGSLAGWIKRLGHRHALNWLARRASRNSALDRYSVERIPRDNVCSLLNDPWRLLKYQRFLDRVAEALAKVSPRQAEAFTLVHIKGNSPRRAASVMGVSISTVRSNVRHARVRLREILEEARDDLS